MRPGREVARVSFDLDNEAGLATRFGAVATLRLQRSDVYDLGQPEAALVHSVDWKPDNKRGFIWPEL